MIRFDEAISIVLSSRCKHDAEQVSIEESVGRILAGDVYSDMDMPPFNKSAVDGYACRASDLDKPMKVLEVIAAGQVPEYEILAGTCSKLMTGGMLPEGADTVVMVEHTEQVDNGHIRFLKDKSSSNVCLRGEDIKKGQKVLERGLKISPREIAVMASVGYVMPLVYVRPTVAVISTGDELVEPHQEPSVSQIRNSNASQLMAQIREAGAIPEYIGIARDTEESTREMLNQAFEGFDLILLSGGVSMGDFDYVPKIFDELGVEILFKSIAVQPGRPTVFGMRQEQYIFGLPGNPVSSFVQFELLVKPLIYKMMGHVYKARSFSLPMGKAIKRKKSERRSLIPAKIVDGKVFPVEYHGSAHIHSYIYAEALIAFEIGQTQIDEGEIVDVRQI